MASSSPAHPDSPITIKVSFNGNTRRITLPLCEVSSTLLLNKVRHDLDHSLYQQHSTNTATVSQHMQYPIEPCTSTRV